MGKWKRISVSSLYERCLKRGHRPTVVRATFDLKYAFCDICRKVYRIRVAAVKELNEDEWPGRPLRKRES